MSTTENTRPRLGLGLVVLLVVLTVANVAGLVLGVSVWSAETTYGGDLGSLELLSILVTVVALTGLAGAWLRRPWGPRLYLAVQVAGLLFLLFTAPGAIALPTFVPLLLAGLLWFLAR